mmetsp:Transcript_16932/g.43497  ORF Transcript_16932/g.43497 Transcript_16932/m.43497 type:complete len:342 (+) Transcript_16932:81-1106(+)
MSEAMANLSKLRQLLQSDPRVANSRPVKLSNVLQQFVAANEDASRSANFASQAPDDVRDVVELVGNVQAMASDDLALRVLKTLKILSRKYENRIRLGELVVADLVRVLGEDRPSAVLGEAANVVLNVCYERDNVARIIAAGGVPPLIGLLSSTELDLQANAAGAIQSICFQTEGRSYVREMGAIPAVLPLLSSPSLKVQTRAVGAVHNISSEPEAIRLIRRLEGIAPLIVLLRTPSASVCGSAAGALQNLSRETTARREIRDLGAVVPLSDLLFGDDVQSQVCAAGALLNLLGPELGAETESNVKRQGFKKLLSLALTIGMVTEPLRAQQLEMQGTQPEQA